MPPAKTLGEHIGYFSSLHQGHPRLQPRSRCHSKHSQAIWLQGGNARSCSAAQKHCLPHSTLSLGERPGSKLRARQSCYCWLISCAKGRDAQNFVRDKGNPPEFFCKTPFPERQATPVSTHGADTARPFPSWLWLLSHNHQMCCEVLGSCWGWRETSTLKTQARAFPRHGRCLVGDDGSQQPASHRRQSRHLSLAQPGPDLRWQRAREDS